MKISRPLILAGVATSAVGLSLGLGMTVAGAAGAAATGATGVHARATSLSAEPLLPPRGMSCPNMHKMITRTVRGELYGGTQVTPR